MRKAAGTGTTRAQAGPRAKPAPSVQRSIKFACCNRSTRTAIALAGLSAGAGMAALLATRLPERFRAIAMHTGIAPGVAHSSATALMAMRGRRAAAMPLAAVMYVPALLVIHGSSDHIVAPYNGAEAARLWGAREGAKPGKPRIVQRGARYAATITDYRIRAGSSQPSARSKDLSCMERRSRGSGLQRSEGPGRIAHDLVLRGQAICRRREIVPVHRLASQI